MKVKLYLPIIILIYISFYACKKSNDTPITPVPTGYQQYGTPFASVPDTKDIILYEVNLRAFSQTGDIQGVINKLDHIRSLGVNVIWLMPIHPIGQINSVNSPYSVKDYKAVSAEYGTLADLRALTTAAHTKGMAVMMDWVANHTAWDHAWIANKAWYTQNSSGNIIHPAGTNWMDVADLNYTNAEMRKAMIDAMRYWVLEANVDGFRCDYADGVPFDFWQSAWQTLDTIPNRKLIYFAEGSRTDHFQAGFDLNFGWASYGAVKNVFAGQAPAKIFTVNNTEYLNVPTDKHWVRFTTNHDESAWDATPISLFNGVNGALAASVVTIFSGGVPLIYSSQEVGTANNIPFFSNSTINWNGNPTMLQAYQKILPFYASSQAAKRGSIAVFAHSDIISFKKQHGTDDLLIIVNPRNTTITYTVPTDLQNTTRTEIVTQNSMTLSGQLILAPYQFYILD